VLVPAHRLLDELFDDDGAPPTFAAVVSHAKSSPLPGQPAVPNHDESHCAICLYAGLLTVATPVVTIVPTPELILVRPERAPPAPVIASLPTPIRGRAPPAC
jgi:hypothetical protein